MTIEVDPKQGGLDSPVSHIFVCVVSIYLYFHDILSICFQIDTALCQDLVKGAPWPHRPPSWHAL